MCQECDRRFFEDRPELKKAAIKGVLGGYKVRFGMVAGIAFVDYGGNHNPKINGTQEAGRSESA